MRIDETEAVIDDLAGGAGSEPGGRASRPAARKLIYLAITNAVPAWTRTRNWTTALLAFKIHFGDRLPD